MARLFTAVELGEATRAALAAAQARMAAALRVAGDRDLRLVQPVHMHLTLAFIGEVAEERVPAIVEVLSGDFPLEPFDVAFGGWGVFPPRGGPRVLWCGVRRGAAELGVLHEHVAARLEAAGVAREPRPYHPHLTLGRWRDRGSSRVRDLLSLPEPTAVEPVRAVTLFRSRLLPAGPEHTPLVRARLAGAGAAPRATPG